MATKARPAVTQASSNSTPADLSSATEQFPPLSISLANFVKDGSDREFRRLVYGLINLSSLMVRNREHFASFIGVTDPQYTMMTLMAENPSVTVGWLAEHMSVTSQFVTVEIAKLMEKNIVEKRPNEADRRSMFLDLTPRGQTLMRELGPLRRRINDMTFKSLNEDRANALQDIISMLVMDAKSALHELEAPQLRGIKAPSA